MKSKAEREAHRDFKRMERNERALTDSVLDYAAACGMDIRRFEPEISQRSRHSLRIGFGCQPTPESQEVLRQLWQNIERHVLFPQQQDFAFSGPAGHGTLEDPQVHIALTRYGPAAYGETIDRNATAELTERFRHAAREQRRNPVAEFRSTGETHRFRMRDGVHTHKDLALFDAMEGLARSHGIPRQSEAGMVGFRVAVKDCTHLHIELNSPDPSIATQATTLVSVLQEAGIRPSSMGTGQWFIPKEGNRALVGPSERDHFGQNITVDIAANGGIDTLTQTLARAVQDRQTGHAARLMARTRQSAGFNR